MRSGPSLGTWILLIVLGVGSLVAGFGAGLWWQDRDVAPESARWVLTHSAQSAQLTPASEGLFTLTLLAAEPVVDGDMVTYPVEVLEPTFIAQDGALRAFTEVTLVLPYAERSVAGTSTDAA